MKKNKKQANNNEEEILEEKKEEKEAASFLEKNRKGLKDLIAPAGIDASNPNYLQIAAGRTRYARSMIVSTSPRMCTFPEFLRGMYAFGDLNVSVFINPVGENTSQTELNRTINELESERIVAWDRGDINRERILAQKRAEAEELRDQIAAGFNKLFDASIICTLFAYSIVLNQHGQFKMKHSEVICHSWIIKLEKYIHLTDVQCQQYSHSLHQKLDMKKVFH